MEAKRKPWSKNDVESLKALVASGASALRASVALKRSLSVTKLKARDLVFPFDQKLTQKRNDSEYFKIQPTVRMAAGDAQSATTLHRKSI